MDILRFLNLDIRFERADHGFRTVVVSSPAGEGAEATFTVPIEDMELENFALRMQQRSVLTRRVDSSRSAIARELGQRLFNSLFHDDLLVALRESVDYANSHNVGLRVRLRHSNAPEVANLPWEYLYDEKLNRFLCLSDRTPIVRFIELPEPTRVLEVEGPLSVLVVVSSPSNFARLDKQAEQNKIHEAIGEVEQAGRLDVDTLDDATLSDLRARLRRKQYHVLHFIGHGGFDDQHQRGVLVLTDDDGAGDLVSGERLSVELGDSPCLRLVVLNSCEGARASVRDPFAGVAQSLIQRGLPAVVAMQFEIGDLAAIRFSQEFYGALADGYPVDAAMGQARKSIYDISALEWATPVLYLRSPDGEIFDLTRPSSVTEQPPRIVLTTLKQEVGNGLPNEQTQAPPGPGELAPRPVEMRAPPPPPGSGGGQGPQGDGSGGRGANRRWIRTAIAAVALLDVIVLIGVLLHFRHQQTPATVWFTEAQADKIGLMEPNKAFREWSLTAKSSPGAIVKGPDGALWFTEEGAARVGRITTTGSLTESVISSAAGGITSGPDGVWFTEPGADKIGRITTAGDLKEFTTLTRISNPLGVPNQTAGPFGITAGPDGTLWFTEVGADKIGRITTTGEVNEFALPNVAAFHAAPEDITAGPDGALWFTETLGDNIGRIDARTHKITEFPAQSPQFIAATPRGDLWFSEINNTNSIARITTAGAVTEFAVPTPDSSPQHLTSGPDGNVWFTERNRDQIGRITPRGVISEFKLPNGYSSPSGIAFQ